MYFHNSRDFKKAKEILDQYQKQTTRVCEVQDSATGLCVEASIACDVSPVYGSYKLQLVKIYGTPEEIFKGFDFTNCKVAYTKDSLIYDSNIESLDDDGILELCHSKSPFLLSRINKYIAFRDYETVSEASRHHVTQWLVKARMGLWNEVNWFYGRNVFLQPFVTYLLRNEDVISNEDLMIMMGKAVMTTTRKQGYSWVSVTKDPVIEELRRRRAN